MGPVVKGQVARRIAAGRRDVYAAFILRYQELVAPGGRVATVTQQSWTFLRPDPSAAGAFAVLLVLSLTPPADDHGLIFCRLIGPKSPEEKDRLLPEAIAALAGAEVAAS